MPDTPAQGPRDTPWAVNAADVAAALEVDLASGLSSQEAQKRLEKHGPNWLREAPARSKLRAFLGQFADWMIGLLAAAAAISVFIGEWQDALLIAGIVVTNAVIGFVQEQRAERAVAALKRLSQPKARLWRNGAMRESSASDLVPGDVIELTAGDVVPADGRLSQAVDLQSDEAALTGESLPVEKQVEPLPETAPLPDRTCMVFAGTAVTRGHGRVAITATGMSTELGKIATLLESTQVTQTPLQRRLAALSRRLAVLVILVCVVVFCVGLLRDAGRPETLFLVAVSLAVAAIPEGLPAVITIALALGSQRMSRRRAIVRQLAAVETLGSVDTICSDKTGTLTQNKMAVSEIQPASEQAGTREALLTAAVLCNDAQVAEDGAILGSATEKALIEAAQNGGLNVQELRRQWPRIAEFTFNSQRKRMSTVHGGPDGRSIAYVKGAPEAVFARATHQRRGAESVPLTDAEREELLGLHDQLAGRGRRLLAVAERTWQGEPPESADEVEQELTLLGIVAIIDPPRPEAREAIEKCRSAGIRVAMITGDHKRTAVAIAQDLGLTDGGAVLDGQQLERLSAEELATQAPETAVFARVTPEHKLRIVRALQSRGCIVAMTGDGVNDAPALKQADIGVAMGITGTDVSKEAARMVLADDNFATIVAAVEEGRVVYDNIRKFVMYLLTANFSEILVILFSILLGWPLPLLPVHLLWINLVTDGMPALALAFEPAEPNVMQRKPRRRDESIFAGGLARDIGFYGLLIAATCLVLYWRYLGEGDAGQTGGDAHLYARSVVFFTLAVSQLWFVLGLRSSSQPLLRQGIWSNWRLAAAVLAGVGLQLAVMYWSPLQGVFHTVPIRPADLAIALAASLVPLVAVELRKLAVSRGQASG